jgi:flagellar hook assembly protein FlgD
VYHPRRDIPPVFVSVQLSAPGYCSVKIYNSAGELVRELWNGSIQTTSKNDFGWDGKNKNGENVASGVYIIFYSDHYQTQRARLLVVQ